MGINEKAMFVYPASNLEKKSQNHNIKGLWRRPCQKESSFSNTVKNILTHAIIFPVRVQSLESEWRWEDEHAQSILLKQPNV